MEAALERLGKSEAVSLICRYPTPQLPEGHFELLGRLDYVDSQGTYHEWPHFFRQLKEDPGTVVGAHPELERFLHQTYERLFLAREVRPARPEGEQRPDQSVFGANLDRGKALAILHPLWDGHDAGTNMESHVKLLRRDGFLNLFFNIDLGRPWETNLVPDLLEHGFQPRLVLPYGGSSDLVVFQHGEIPA